MEGLRYLGMIGAVEHGPIILVSLLGWLVLLAGKGVWK